jgi:hypothetical protein
MLKNLKIYSFLNDLIWGEGVVFNIGYNNKKQDFLTDDQLCYTKLKHKTSEQNQIKARTHFSSSFSSLKPNKRNRVGLIHKLSNAQRREGS